MRCWLVLLLWVGTASAGSAPDLAFARGKAALAVGDDDAAIAILDELAEQFPTYAHADHAAWLVLDALDRGHRFVELFAHIERYMHERPLLLMRHRRFANRVRGLYVQCVWQDHCAAPGRSDYEQLALANLGELAANPRADYGDELLFAAGWQFCISGHPDEAKRAWDTLLALFPQSTLAVRAQAGLGDLESCR